MSLLACVALRTSRSHPILIPNEEEVTDTDETRQRVNTRIHAYTHTHMHTHSCAHTHAHTTPATAHPIHTNWFFAQKPTNNHDNHRPRAVVDVSPSVWANERTGKRVGAL